VTTVALSGEKLTDQNLKLNSGAPRKQDQTPMANKTATTIMLAKRTTLRAKDFRKVFRS
jgi:hypothetical protein